MDAKIGLEYATFLQRRGSIGRAEDILIGLNKRSPNDPSILTALGMVKLARQDWGRRARYRRIRSVESMAPQLGSLIRSLARPWLAAKNMMKPSRHFKTRTMRLPRPHNQWIRSSGYF